MELNNCVSSTSASISSFTLKESIKNARASIMSFTTRGMQIYGDWSKDEIIELLTKRLEQCAKGAFQSPITEARLQCSRNSGLYSIPVLSDLKQEGMSSDSILKAMKLGLINLEDNELACFNNFGVIPEILQAEGIGAKNLDDELIGNLKVIGLNDYESWNIILFGVVTQKEDILCRLIFSGMDVPGIFNWQGPINPASSAIIQFLHNIGVQDDILEIVQEYGIDDETRQMISDLGYYEVEEEEPEIVCECSLTTAETESSESKETDIKLTTSSDSIHHRWSKKITCDCYSRLQNATSEELTAQRNDYIRQNAMVPLAWALSRTSRYGPSDPIYYAVYQLLRWNYGDATQQEKDSFREYVASATTIMDNELIEKILEEEQNVLRKKKEEAVRNIPCKSCKDRHERYCVKSPCAKCRTVYRKKVETCMFPEICSSCRIHPTVQDISRSLNLRSENE